MAPLGEGIFVMGYSERAAKVVAFLNMERALAVEVILMIGVAFIATAAWTIGYIDQGLGISLPETLEGAIGVAAGVSGTVVLEKRLRGKRNAIIKYAGLTLPFVFFALVFAVDVYRLGRVPATAQEFLDNTAAYIGFCIMSAFGLALLWRFRTPAGPRSGAGGLLGVNRVFQRVHFVWWFISRILVCRLGFVIAYLIVTYQFVYWSPRAAALFPRLNFAPLRIAAGLLFLPVFFAAIQDLWRLLIALIDTKAPLEDEKALGAAKRAPPEKTAAGALGAGEPEAIHTQRFTD